MFFFGGGVQWSLTRRPGHARYISFKFRCSSQAARGATPGFAAVRIFPLEWKNGGVYVPARTGGNQETECDWGPTVIGSFYSCWETKHSSAARMREAGCSEADKFQTSWQGQSGRPA